MTRPTTIHFRRAGGHKTACGKPLRATRKDTQRKDRVTCRNCLRVIRAESR